MAPWHLLADGRQSVARRATHWPLVGYLLAALFVPPGMAILVRSFAFNKPLPGPALVAVAVMSALGMLAIDFTRQQSRPREHQVLAVAQCVFAVVALALLVRLSWGCSWPAILVAWLAWSATLAWVVAPNNRPRPDRSPALPLPLADGQGEDASESTSCRPVPLAERTQQWSQPAEIVVEEHRRTRAPDGAEMTAGTLREALEPGQRVVQFHLAFCPPLAAAPQIEVEQIEGPDARWKVAQAWPHAARIEGKLAQAAGPGDVAAVEFVARATAS